MSVMEAPPEIAAVEDPRLEVVEFRPVVIADLMHVPDALAELKTAWDAVNGVVIEQPDYIAAQFRAFISRTHLFATGTGGVGKTYGDEKVAEVLGVSRFYTQFRPDMKREEAFGPLAMSGLANDRYEHVIGQGFLQDVEKASLDEFADAGRFTRQLLNALNERWFVNGAKRMRIPLISATAMTNFWPNEPALAALMDRLVQRIVIKGDLSDDGFMRVLELGVEQRAAEARGEAKKLELPKVSREALGTLMHHAALVDVKRHIVETIKDVRRDAEREGLVDRSPRRWSMAIAVAQAEALLHGRDAVSETDLRVLKLILPDAEDEFDIAADLTKGFRDPIEQFIEGALPAVNELARAIDAQLDKRKTTPRPTPEDFEVITSTPGKIDEQRAALQEEIRKAKGAGRPTERLDDLVTRLDEIEANLGPAAGLKR